jgi:hypothetical protein
VCSRSKRRRNACHQRSTSVGVAPVAEVHNQTGLGLRSPGRCWTCSRIRVCRTTSRLGAESTWRHKYAERASLDANRSKQLIMAPRPHDCQAWAARTSLSDVVSDQQGNIRKPDRGVLGHGV